MIMALLDVSDTTDAPDTGGHAGSMSMEEILNESRQALKGRAGRRELYTRELKPLKITRPSTKESSLPTTIFLPPYF